MALSQEELRAVNESPVTNRTPGVSHPHTGPSLDEAGIAPAALMSRRIPACSWDFPGDDFSERGTIGLGTGFAFQRSAAAGDRHGTGQAMKGEAMPTIESFVRPVVTAQPQNSLHAVARLMEEHNVGAVVIVEGRRPVGILTDRDLALELGARGTSPETPAVRVMSTPVTVVESREGMFDITRAIRDTRVRRLPVVDDDGALVGIVAVDDLIRVMGQETANLLEGLTAEMAVR
jgi:CBS domain-containing protein